MESSEPTQRRTCEAVQRSRLTSGLQRRAKPLLGTLVEIAIPACDDDTFLRATELAFAEVAEVHRAMSFHEAASDLRTLARAAKGSVLPVSPDTWRVLRLALELETLSRGVFNVAVAPTLVANGLLPMPDAAQTPVARSLTEGIELLGDNRLRVLSPLWVDLGGIAKGHAVDRAVTCLQSMGIASGLVNAGGDMRAFGADTHPVQLRLAGGLRAVAMLKDGALASSSNADCADAEHSPHVDPRSGRSVQSAQAMVVQAASTAVADALTKVAMLCPSTADRMCMALQAQWRAFDHVASLASTRQP